MRYFFQISYKGNKYKGWQKQANTVGCVQEILEKKLEEVFKVKVSLVGCGRTDAGVHASMYFAHADFDEAIDLAKLSLLSYRLPTDIVVHDIYETNLHARFDALQRAYEYKIHFKPNPFLYDLSSLYLDIKLDIDKINKACEIIKKQSEFYNFCKSPLRVEATNCKVFDCYFEFNTTNAIFHIRCNRFLKSMVRILVHDVISIGLGELTIEEFESYFIKENPRKPLKFAPPQGLYLSDIVYKKNVNRMKGDKSSS